MSFGDVLVLAVVGVWLAAVIASYIARRKHGCCGGCQACWKGQCTLRQKKENLHQ
jgi:hypothetical protein